MATRRVTRLRETVQECSADLPEQTLLSTDSRAAQVGRVVSFSRLIY